MDFVVILLVRLVERMKIVIVIILHRRHDHDNEDDGDDGDEVHLNDHLLLRRVERFWLFPLVDRRGFHRPTGMEPVDIVIFIHIVFFSPKIDCSCFGRPITASVIVSIGLLLRSSLICQSGK